VNQMAAVRVAAAAASVAATESGMAALSDQMMEVAQLVDRAERVEALLDAVAVANGLV